MPEGEDKKAADWAEKQGAVCPPAPPMKDEEKAEAPAPAPAPAPASAPPEMVLSMTNIRCWGKFWSQYKAKDKTARIFQYFTRILVVWFRAKQGPDSEMAETLWYSAAPDSPARPSP